MEKLTSLDFTTPDLSALSLGTLAEWVKAGVVVIGTVQASDRASDQYISTLKIFAVEPRFAQVRG